MSTGADCRFMEVSPGHWKYELQRYPYGANEDYDAYGPFLSFKRALAHLHDNHANPGGYSINTHAQHAHEWETMDGGYRDVGFVVEVAVQSLGPLADRDAVIAHIKNLPADHPAWRVRPDNRWDGAYKRVACNACGQAPVGNS